MPKESYTPHFENDDTVPHVRELFGESFDDDSSEVEDDTQPRGSIKELFEPIDNEASSSEIDETTVRREDVVGFLTKNAFEVAASKEKGDSETPHETESLRHEVEALRGEIMMYRDQARNNAHRHIELLNRSAEQLNALGNVLQQGGLGSIDRLRHEFHEVRDHLTQDQKVSIEDENIRFNSAAAIKKREKTVNKDTIKGFQRLDQLVGKIRATTNESSMVLDEVDMLFRINDPSTLLRAMDGLTRRLRMKANNFHNESSADLVDILQHLARDITEK